MPILQRYNELPDIPSGYALDDVWAVVIPIARTNLVINPSFETNTTSWTAIGGSIARSTTQQYHGAYSLAITPTATTTDGARFDTVSLTSGTTYAYSAKVRGVAGLQYSINIETTGGVAVATKTFLATGRWQWIVGYYTETSTTTRRFTARKAGSNASIAIFYLDGVQVEAIAAGELASTYIDGDQLGLVPNQNPVPYVWNGTPHASTSTRSGLTRAGGMVIPFKRFGFLLVAMIGLGIATPQNTSFEYARIDGGYDDYTRKPSDQFTLTGRFQGRTYGELRRNRSGLGQYFDRDLVAQDQRLTLLHHIEDHNGNTISSEARILAKYQGGFEGKMDNMHAEQTSMTFTQYLPVAVADGEVGAALNVQTSIASNANGILQHSPAGTWSSMGSVTAGFKAISIVRGLDGLIYLGGDFTPAPAADIASWNGSAFGTLGTGATGGLVYQMVILPNGNLIAAGTFAAMGGVANTNKVALWNGSVWSSISAAFVGTEIRCVAISAAGIVYFGGVFTSIGGVAATNVTSYNPATTTWAAVGGGIAAGGVSALITSGTTVYAAVENSNVQRIVSGGAWTNIGTVTGGGADPQALALAPNGDIYAAGDFTTIGGVSANYIARYNGTSWFPLGTGLNNTVNVLALSFDQKGLLHAGGTFTTAGGITTPTGGAIWNGSAWVYEDIIPAAAASMYGMLSLPTGQAYIGTTNGGTAIAPGTTTITNTGTARSYPTVVIQGPSSGTARIYSLFNTTTSRNIWLNLTLSAGETATLILQPGALSFTSTFQGNIANSILPGSNAADFFLQPGVNTIQFLSASSTVTATLYFRPAYLSIDDIP